MESLEFGVVQFSWYSWVALHQFTSSTKSKFERVSYIFWNWKPTHPWIFILTNKQKKKTNKNNSQKLPPTNSNDFTVPRSMTFSKDVSHQPKGTKHSIYISHYRLVGQKVTTIRRFIKVQKYFKITVITN